MAERAPMACVRVQQFPNWAAVSSMARHGTRTLGRLANVDPARTPLNSFESEWGDGRDPVACMQALMAYHDARIRKGGSPGTHMLLTASAEYFRPGRPDAAGNWNPDRLQAWMAANRAWLTKRFPGQVAALRVDLDETTPHCDVFLVPLNRRTTKTGKRIVEVSHRTQFSKGRGPRAYAQLQTEYAQAMAHLGLARGRPKAETYAMHKSPVTLRAELSTAQAEAGGFAAGVRAWSEGRMSHMDWTEDRRQTARFRSDVSPAERRRLFRVCRPAWVALVAFSRRMEGLLRQVLGERAQETDRLLGEAQLLLDELTLQGTGGLEESNRISSMSKRLHRR